MAATNDQKNTVITEAEERDQVEYLKAEEERKKAAKVPAKVSGFPLVYFVEVNGELYPVYRH